MSVILDALHKARGDKRNPPPEPRPNSVARVLDAGVASERMLDNHDGHAPARRRRRGGWVIVLAAIVGIGCLCLLIAGAFFLLYNQGKRLEESRIVDRGASETTVAPVNAAIPVISGGDTVASTEAAKVLETGLNLPPVPALPTPLALSDLPVQPPVINVPSAVNTAAAPVAPTVAPPVAPPAPALKLGSIVCENEDCLASLNGRTVRVGDEIRQYRVVRITSKEVTLKSTTGNDIVTLSLYD